MTETHDRESPDRVNVEAIRVLESAWRRFEGALVRYLTAMARNQGRNTLVLELAGPNRTDGTTSRHLELASDGEDRLVRASTGGSRRLHPMHQMDDDERADLRRRGWDEHDHGDGGWSTDRPAAELAELAAEAVWLLRRCHHVAHPDLLTHRSEGPACLGAERLGLVPTAEVPVEPRASIRLAQARVLDDDPPMPIVTTSIPDLVSLVEAAVEDGADIHVDFALCVGRQPVLVRVSDDQTSVRLSARVVRAVSSPSEARTDIRIFNRDGWLDWHVARRDIWVSGTVPCDPFDSSKFRTMLEEFLEVLSSHRHALARRTGGRAY